MEKSFLGGCSTATAILFIIAIVIMGSTTSVRNTRDSVGSGGANYLTSLSRERFQNAQLGLLQYLHCIVSGSKSNNFSTHQRSRHRQQASTHARNQSTCNASERCSQRTKQHNVRKVRTQSFPPIDASEYLSICRIENKVCDKEA